MPFEQRMRKISDMMVDIVLIHGIEATLLHPIVHEACEGRDSADRVKLADIHSCRSDFYALSKAEVAKGEACSVETFQS